MDPRILLDQLAADRYASGTDLARRLRVTRAAVWKQVQVLRELGAPIEAEAGRGYRLGWPIEWLDAQSIGAELTPAQRKRVGTVAVHWQIDSTNSELLRRAAHDDAADLLACCAETQSAGRGRRGREWRSPLGGNLYFSVLKRFDRGMGALTGLSLAAGTAVVAALADCAVGEVGLKWPNDVLARGRKLAGVLIELGGEFLGPSHAVIGIGINLRLPAAVVVAIDQPAIDIATLTGGDVPSRNRLAGRLLGHLIDALDRFADQGFEPFRAEYDRFDLLRGAAVRVHDARGAHDGVATGIDARGALCVRHAEGIAAYDSADVSVRTQ
jgi:BirA family biotin operon repressor/biotin-[acetyl-CoA-carboxylase] ligase